MHRDDLIKNIIKNIKTENPIFVEIGTHEGYFSDIILSCNKNAILYCIDPYIKYDDYYDSINNITGTELYLTTKDKLEKKYGNRIIFIRDFSYNTTDLLPNNIDLLYIDGNHQYKYVYKDLELYYPKIKQGGYIIGDDAVDTDNNKRDNEGNVFIEWSKGCSGKYGVAKAFNDFIKTNSHIIQDKQIIGTQYIIYS